MEDLIIIKLNGDLRVAKEQGCRRQTLLFRAHPLYFLPVRSWRHRHQPALHLEELLRRHRESENPPHLDLLGSRQRSVLVRAPQTSDQGRDCRAVEEETEHGQVAVLTRSLGPH